MADDIAAIEAILADFWQDTSHSTNTTASSCLDQRGDFRVDDCSTLWLPESILEHETNSTASSSFSFSPRVCNSATRRCRISTKQQIVNLREEVAQLTLQLQELQATRSQPLNSETPVSTIQAWERIAELELNQRQKTEEDNIKLKVMMQLQIEEARNLRRLLKRRSRIEMLEKMFGLRGTTISSSVDTRENPPAFERLTQDVELLYIKMDTLLVSKGVFNLPCPGRKCRAQCNVLNGINFELMERNIIPFAMNMTEEAVWAALVQLELKDLQTVDFSSAEVQFHEQTSDSGHDTAMISFFATSSGDHATGVQVRKVVRKYVEANRTVFVHRSLMKPKLFEHNGAVGVTTSSTLVIILENGSMNGAIGETTLVQSYFNATRYDEGLPAAERLRLPSSLQKENAMWDESISRIYRRVENFLVDHCCVSKLPSLVEYPA